MAPQLFDRGADHLRRRREPGSETVPGVITKFLVDTQTPTGYAQVTEELVGNAVAVRYTYGAMRISQNRLGTVNYFGYEVGGSVRELLNSSGAVTDTYTYDAFGNNVAETGSTINEFLYRGEQLDPMLRMYYLRGRYYVPLTGRFLTVDSVEEVICACSVAGEPPAGINHLYRYTPPDPVDYQDPTGHGFIDKVILTGVVLWQTNEYVAVYRAFCVAMRAAVVIYHARRIITGDGTTAARDWPRYNWLIKFPMCSLITVR